MHKPISITDIFREYGYGYLQQFEKRMPRTHLNAMHAIGSCRTPQRGTILAQCNDCHKQHVLFCACGNRHCPACQNHKAQAWLTKQIEKALPCNYFLITFTVPEALRRIIRSHQRVGYEALFASSADALKTLAQNPRFAGGGQTGFTGVLHTWGRQIQYHPHVHYVVPGGTVINNGKDWAAARPGFFLPVRALSKLYKAAYRTAMQRAGLIDLIPNSVWQQDWIVHSQPAGNGEHTFRYLARYIFKVGISNSRIVAVRDGMVTFRWQKKDSRRWRTTTITAVEFIRRYLQHVLPTGFVKVRHYGFANHNAAIDQADLYLLVLLTQNFEGRVPSPIEDQKPRPQCNDCGGTLTYIHFSKPAPRERTVMQLT